MRTDLDLARLHNWFRYGCLLAPLALMTAGCSRSDSGAPRAAVTGVVTLDGRPLTNGMVRFVPTDGTKGPKTAVAVSVGMFSVDARHGPVVGRHRIEIESTDHGDFPPDDETALQRLKAAGAKGVKLLRIPPRFNVDSQIVESVSADGPNEFRFLLTTAQKSNRNR